MLKKLILSLVLFSGVTLSLSAFAEYTEIEATCNPADTGSGAPSFQIWFTFKSEPATPLNPNPKQVVYHLVFGDNGGGPGENPVAVARGTPDMDLMTADRQLELIQLISTDGSYRVQLAMGQDKNGRSTGVARGKALFTGNSPGNGLEFSIQCGVSGVALFRP